MTVTSSGSAVAVDRSFDELVERHAERFRRYLRGMLGGQAEGQGGRIDVDDALQEALLAIYKQWPRLVEVPAEERNRRLYRCLRDAVGMALRAEHGRRTQVSARPRMLAFDFGALQHGDVDGRPVRERELTVAVLDAIVRDTTAHEDARAMLDHEALVSGLRALTEREAVILIAVDHYGRDQHQLADRLGIGCENLRHILYVARQVFRPLVRHAAGIEVDAHERARLRAFLAGELRGTEKRVLTRHLQHCWACQELQREHRVREHQPAGRTAG